jgi:Ca2+-binding EF-hand superfamily protein
MELDPAKLEKIVTEGSPPHEIHSQPVPHDDLICKYKPYDHIFAPYDRRVHEYFKCGVGLAHPFDRLVRTRIIARMIQSDIEYDKTKQGGAGLKLLELKNQGKIINYFALHDESLRETVYKNWVLRSTWPWALPSNLIRAYFGEKVALFFAFTAHYTTWLLPLAIVGFVTQLEILQGGYDRASMLVVFCTCVSLWSCFMLDAWKRKEWHHTMTWGMSRFFNTESQRPEFKGVSRPSVRDGLPELYYPEWTRRKQLLFSGVASAVFNVANIAVQVFIFSFKTLLSSYNFSDRVKEFMLLGSSVATTVQIGVADGLYQVMAIALTERENHRLDSQYYDSLIFKFAVFQLFNNYSSLFYVAFVKPAYGLECNTTMSSANPCMHELGLLLGIIFLSEVLSNMVYELVLPRLRSRARAASEGLGSDGMALDVATGRGFMSSVAEREAVLEEYDIIFDLLMDYKTINIQFGYLTFFVAALPVLPVIAFCANVLEIRVDGHKLLKEHRCPANHGASNIGMWKSVFTGYGVLAVVSNAALICFQTDLLGATAAGSHVDNATRIWYFFFSQYFVFSGQLLVALLIEDVPREVAIQLARQTHFNVHVFDKLAAGGSDVLERFRDMSRKLSRNSDGSGNNYNRIFELLSIDGTTISSHSLKLGLNLIGFKTTDLDMKILMNRIDADKSGTLDLDEFKSFVVTTAEDDVRNVCRRVRHRLAHRLDEVVRLFDKHDKDGSGYTHLSFSLRAQL